LYQLLYDPSARDVFLAMLGGNPAASLQLAADDLTYLYNSTRAMFGGRFIGSLLDEANDVLSLTGSTLHPNVPVFDGKHARGILHVNGVDVPLSDYLKTRLRVSFQ
jgi:hypothetical protein